MNVLVGYWPIWLLLIVLAVLVVEVMAIMAAGDRCDDQAHRALDELEARRALRPHPAPIDVELVRDDA